MTYDSPIDTTNDQHLEDGINTITGPWMQQITDQELEQLVNEVEQKANNTGLADNPTAYAEPHPNYGHKIVLEADIDEDDQDEFAHKLTSKVGKFARKHGIIDRHQPQNP